MAHPIYHARSSAKKWGGKPEDYLPVHAWFDQSKSIVPDHRHRALLHHAFGIFLCEQVFGQTITNSEGREVPTRYIGEQHVREDAGGRIWTAQDWLSEMTLRPWMGREALSLSREFAQSEDASSQMEEVLSIA